MEADERRKRTTIVSVRQLYKQIKRQRAAELAKQPDKVYTAEEEARMRAVKERLMIEKKARRELRLLHAREEAKKYEPSHLRLRKVVYCTYWSIFSLNLTMQTLPAGPMTPPPGIEWDYPEDDLLLDDQQPKETPLTEWPIAAPSSSSAAAAHATTATATTLAHNSTEDGDSAAPGKKKKEKVCAAAVVRSARIEQSLPR